MIATERKLYENRIENFIKRLETLFYEDEIGLRIEFSRFEGILPFSERWKGKYETIEQGTVWGKNWDRAWFFLSGSVPAEWKGKQVVARIDLGGEGLIFSSEGRPLQSVSVHSLWNAKFRRDRFEIAEKAAGNEKVELWIEASAGQLFGLQLSQENGWKVPENFGSYEAQLNEAVLCLFRKDIWHFYLDCLVLNDLMKSLPERGVRRARLLLVMNQAIDNFQEDRQKVEKARLLLRPELMKKASASQLATTAIGHAHLDTAWLWPLSETIRKCARTFSTQIDLIEKYHEYIFGASQAQHYALVKKYYPELFAKIKEKIAAGRWEVQGGMWVEADCNIISGESMIRQILHGKNFFKDEFGVEAKNLWLPDIFGYSAAMPQILKKSGLDYFVTQKISWSQFNKFPHHTFIWQGIDGSEVITHFPPENNYNSDLKPSALKFAEENFEERSYLPEFLTLYGIGDGGGGPTEEIIETGLRQKDLEGSPRVKFEFAQFLLERLDRHRAKLPRWVGELYLEIHRGTLTTQAHNKKMNRFMELKLRELELLFSTLPSQDYPANELEAMWKLVLLNQFHDIIPGSSATPVYEDSRRDYEKLIDQADRLTDKFAELRFIKNEDTLCLVNTLSYAYSRPIELPVAWHGWEIFDESGKKIAVQNEGSRSVADIKILPLSAKTLRRGKKTIAKINSPTCGEKIILENDLICYEFDQNGQLKAAYDKQAKKQILPEGQVGNVLRLYEDRPVNWDAWDIDIFYEKQQREIAHLLSQSWLCRGTVRQGVQQDFKIGSSEIVQEIYLAANSKRLDFDTEVNWIENHKMLRVSFAVNVFADTASFEIQYGYIKRPTHRNTSWDMAKFEVVAHRFADLSDHDYGVALLNDSKYGHKILGNVIDLNLLRSSTNPDPKADRGRHNFTYSLLPHTGELIASEVFSEAAQLNQKPAIFENYDGTHFSIPCSLDRDEIVLEVLKKAEKEEAAIVRLREPKGKTAEATLTIALARATVFETDLMENNIRELKLENQQIKLQFSKFEIKTLKVIQV